MQAPKREDLKENQNHGLGVKDMKIVREHIFEKFIEDSDPITDMGIGMFKVGDVVRRTGKFGMTFTRDTRDNLGKWKIEFMGNDTSRILGVILRREVDGSNIKLWFAFFGNERKVYTDILPYLDKGYKYFEDRYSVSYGEAPIDIWSKYIEKENEKKLLEKFTEDSDPIEDMGIGSIKYFKEFIQLLESNSYLNNRMRMVDFNNQILILYDQNQKVTIDYFKGNISVNARDIILPNHRYHSTSFNKNKINNTELAKFVYKIFLLFPDFLNKKLTLS